MNDPKEMRVAVARDVLAQLHHLRLSRSVYLKGGFALDHDIENLQYMVDRLRDNCEACAIGAVFLSYVRVYDGVTTAEFASNRYGEGSTCDAWMSEKLNAAFSPGMLREIERFYQGWNGRNVHDEEHEALRLIMENIVENGGDFRPEPSWQEDFTA